MRIYIYIYMYVYIYVYIWLFKNIMNRAVPETAHLRQHLRPAYADLRWLTPTNVAVHEGNDIWTCTAHTAIGSTDTALLFERGSAGAPAIECPVQDHTAGRLAKRPNRRVQSYKDTQLGTLQGAQNRFHVQRTRPHDWGPCRAPKREALIIPGTR